MAELQFAEPVTLVGNGALRRRTLDLACAIAPTVIAADGGANRLGTWGIAAHAIVGDLDSVENLIRWEQANTVILERADQNSTDLAKCLQAVAAPLYIAVGFLGDRLDHSMVAMGQLGADPTKSVVLVGGSDIVFAPPRQWSAKLPVGSRLSIVATGTVAVSRAHGLRWSPVGHTFEPTSTLGISNVVEDRTVELEFVGSGALLVVERELLPTVVKSLLVEQAKA